MPAIARAIVLIAGLCGAAHADSDRRPRSPPTTRRALAVAAAVVPGALVHGSGHFALGDRRTARRLLIMEGVGLALLGTGGAVAGLSGWDENLALFYVPLLAGGATTVMGSFLADFLGVSLPAGDGTGADLPNRPTGDSLVTVATGYRHVAHPNLDLGHLSRTTIDLQLEGLRLGLAAELGLEAGYRDYAIEAAYRLPWRPAGGELVAGVDLTRRRLMGDQLTSFPAALWAEGVWPLGRLVPRLPGGYARARLGLGVEVVDYQLVAGTDDDVVPFLVAAAGLGFRLGRLDLELSYDHRKDGFPGGAYLGRVPGFLGSFGAAGRLHLYRRYTLTGELRYGTGMTAWLAVEHSF